MDRREAIKNAIVVLGGTVSLSSLQLIISACDNGDTIESAIFSKSQVTALELAIDRIIPETDTPSATQVGVVPFIEIVLQECYNLKTRNTFAAGLTQLNEKGFKSNKPEDQDNLLTRLESSDDPFFRLLKELTLVGYFTSEEGIKQNFDYAPVPGRFDGCVDYDPERKNWRGNKL